MINAIYSAVKISNPVDCRTFFHDQIQEGRPGLWRVRLQPNGQILELIDLSEVTPWHLRQFLKWSPQNPSDQSLWVEIRPRWDQVHPHLPWIYKHIFSNFQNACDYLIFCGSEQRSFYDQLISDDLAF